MIKYIIHNNYTENTPKGNEVFCKKQHNIIPINEDNCFNCPYFTNFLEGKGVSCYWEDCVDVNQTNLDIPYDSKELEMLRVSKLIDLGYIKKW